MNKRKRDSSDENQKPAKNARSFNAKWLQLFAWLTFDSIRNAMFCTICQKHKKKNNFVYPGASNFRKSSLVDHASSNDHVQALKSDEAAKDNKLKTMVEKVYEKTDDAMTTLFRNAYYIAKENLPIDKYQSLNELSKMNGAPITSTMYQEDTACSEFIKIISSQIEQTVLQDVKDSPAFSIMIDESTDLSTQKHLILYLSYLKDAKLTITYSKLINLTACDSVAITSQLIAYLQANDVDLSKMYGMGSDGAAVMIGKHTGVSQLLKENSPYLIEMHCVAHRLALACVDLSKEIPEIKFVESIIKTVYTYFKRSPSNLSELRTWQTILDDPQLNPLDVHKVRWLSMGHALDNLRRSLVSIVHMVSDQGDSDIVASSMVHHMTSYKFLFLLHFLSDIFSKINILSKALQQRELSYSTVRLQVDGFLTALSAEYLTDEPSFGPLLSQFILTTSEQDNFKGIDFSRSPRDATLPDKVVHLVSTLTDNIKDRFPDSKIFEAFTIFEPASFPVNISDLPNYGTSQLSTLTSHYTSFDEDSTLQEWSTIKYIIFNNFRHLSPAELLTEVTPMKEQFVNIVNLIEIASVLPVSSVECERGFSRQNLIKTKLRCKTSTDTLDQLMRIGLVGVPVKDFDPKPALRQWQSNRQRQVYQSNKQNAFSKLMNIR